MKRIIYSYLILLPVICITITSCNFLDVEKYFDDTLKYDSIFSNKRHVEAYMWGIASQFPDEGKILSGNYTPGPVATDEAFCTFNTTEFRGMGYVLGEVSQDDLKGMDSWTSMYKIIRKCNILLDRIDEAADMTMYDRINILGYTYFIRAYAYYHILMDFGPVVLLGDEYFNSNEDSNYYNRHRATYDESVNYICEELEKAALYMEDEPLVSNFGRPGKWAAYGLIARLRLQQASPLYNGGNSAKTVFGEWTRSIDGVHYVSQEYKEEKWAVAAAAAKRIIDSGKFVLHTVKRDDLTPELPSTVSSADFPDGAGDIDPFKSYSDMFTGEAISVKNKEFLWGRMSEGIKEVTKHSFNADVMGGWNGMSVTQKVVDAYYMADGRDKNDSSAEYPYSETGFTSGSSTFSGYQLGGSDGVSNMYANREMRFYASVGFSERYWTASSTSETNRKNRVITYYYGTEGNSGKNSSNTNPDDYPPTGYVITKYIHGDDAWTGTNATVIDKPFPIIRYAEILLIYAEALNNLTTTHTIEMDDETVYTVSRDINEIKKAFDQVRYRAGLPGLTATELSVSTTVQELIERERMIEFLFENRRYYDVRRWGKYEETESEPIRGMNMDGSKSEFYDVVVVNHQRARDRIVNKRMILLPIPKNEVRMLKDLDQNPGWGS